MLKEGKVVSWGTTPWTGAFECKPSLYPTSSRKYRASVQAGCKG